MRPGRAALLICVAYVLSACGASVHEQVQEKVQQFARATAERDVATLCSQVLAPALVAHLNAAQLSCRQAMSVFVASVRNPTISVSRISVHGTNATAVVLAAASGQPAALEQITLVLTQRGWRLASLAAPR